MLPRHTRAYVHPWLALGVLLAAGCTAAPRQPLVEDTAPPARRPEALSMFGRPLYRPPLDPGREALLDLLLDSAANTFRARPSDPDALLWLGRRLADLGHYRDAIAAFTRGINLHPADARFYRFRGHRYITCRQFDLALADLQLAATLVEGKEDQFEPEGEDRTYGPLSTLQGNIFYHLALAHYLRQEYAQAAPVWERARTLARNDDTLAAASYWLYLTYRKLGRKREADEVLQRIRPDMRVTENRPYLDLLRLFRGELTPDSLAARAAEPGQLPVYGYGLASWYRFNGDDADAAALLRGITKGEDWAAIEYIAAEAELERAERTR